MENVSKTLIIASAILVSVLLISIALILINSLGGFAGTASNTMTSQAIQVFNAQFLSYEGTGKSSKEIIQLLDTITASNASYSNQVVVKLIRCGGSGGVMDTARFALFDSTDGRLYRCSSSNIVTFDDMKSAINTYSNSKYTVRLHYCNDATYQKKGNNGHLNPVVRLYCSN